MGKILDEEPTDAKCIIAVSFDDAETDDDFAALISSIIEAVASYGMKTHPGQTYVQYVADRVIGANDPACEAVWARLANYCAIFADVYVGFNVFSVWERRPGKEVSK